VGRSSHHISGFIPVYSATTGTHAFKAPLKMSHSTPGCELTIPQGLKAVVRQRAQGQLPAEVGTTHHQRAIVSNHGGQPKPWARGSSRIMSIIRLPRALPPQPHHDPAQVADVVLPRVTFAEKDGTFTNTERRVQLVRKAVEPPGEARADWEIICDTRHHRQAAATDRASSNSSQRRHNVTASWPGFGLAKPIF